MAQVSRHPNGILGALKLESRAAPQDGSKMDPEGPKTAQDAPKDGSRRPQDGPKWAPGGFFEAFLGLLKLFRVARVVKNL